MPGNDANTKLLLHCNGIDTSTSFPDSSVAAPTHSVTAVGNAQVDTAISKWGGASGLFDGTGDYLTVPDSADWDWVDDKTIDMQVNHDAAGSEKTFIGQLESGTDLWELQKSPTNILRFYLKIDDSSVNRRAYSTVTISANTWHHLAVIRTGGNYGVYMDGDQVAFSWDMGYDSNLAGALTVGWDGVTSRYYDGSIDEIRVQADNYFLAAPNSFPAASALLYGEGTDGDTTMSNDGYSGAVTLTNATLEDTQTHLNATTSMFFNGTTAYATVVDTSGTDYDVVNSLTDSWTIDTWIWHDNTGSVERWTEQNASSIGWDFFKNSSDQLIFRAFNGGGWLTSPANITSTATITVDTWQHVTLIKSGINIGTYLDGVQVAYGILTGTDNTAASLVVGRSTVSGQYMDGYMEQFQVTKGNKFGVVPMPAPLTHFKCNDNAASTVVTDDGSGAIDAVSSANTTSLTATGLLNEAFFFNSTYYLTATSTFAATESDTTGSFSFWYKTSATNDYRIWCLGAAFATAKDTATYISMGAGRIQFWVHINGTNAMRIIGTALINNGAWHHVAIVQDGVQGKIYIDGVNDALTVNDGTSAGNWINAANDGFLDLCTMGGSQGFYAAGDYIIAGTMDDFRYYQATALNATQVAQIYNDGTGSELTYPVGLTVPTAVLTQDTITEPTAEYAEAALGRSQAVIIA